VTIPDSDHDRQVSVQPLTTVSGRPRTIKRVGDGRWAIDSRTDEDVTYSVHIDLERPALCRCQCKGYGYHATCSHIDIAWGAELAYRQARDAQDEPRCTCGQPAGTYQYVAGERRYLCSACACTALARGGMAALQEAFDPCALPRVAETVGR